MSRITRFSIMGLLALGVLSAAVVGAEEKSSSTAAKSTVTPAASTTHSSSHHKAPKIDLNAGTKEELMKLPGVDAATADKIIAARPYKAKSDLEKVLGKAEYQKVSAHVVIKTAK